VRYDPFAELGLPAVAELTDIDVHAAWRRIAAATHPDREDGGDPARFGAAAAAYVLLKTSFGRGEALADLSAGARRGRRRRNGSTQDPRLLRNPRLPWPVRLPWYSKRRGAHRLQVAAAPARFRHAGDTRIRLAGYVTVDRELALPAGAAALGAAAAIAVVGWTPATIGLVAGALTVTAWGLWRRAWRDR
jgi:hypothetical protein